MVRAVIAFGAEASSAAEIYCNGTGGRLYEAFNTDEVVEAIGRGSSAVVVTTAERITAESLEVFNLDGLEEVATGILCAPAEGLEKIASIRARQFLDGTGQPVDRFLDFCSGRPLPGGEIRKPCRTLAVKAHSDGIALSLKDSYLCPIPFLSARPEAAPPCIRTQACTRLNLRTFDEAVAEGSVIDPATLECDLLILSACYGWTVSGSRTDLTVSLGLSLASAPNVSAMITTHGLLFENFETRRFSQDILSMLSSGCSLGEALASLNRSSAIRRLGLVFSLFGDPDIRFSP